jgi:Skp family chaperone for outer membrane proteins
MTPPSIVPRTHALAAAFALAALALVGSTASAQAPAAAGLKLGKFDKQRVVDESKLGTGAKARFEKLQASRETEVEDKRKAYEALQKAYEQQEGVLSEEKKLERQRELARSRDELQSSAGNADRDLQRAYQQALVEIVQKLDPVIEDFAKAEGYDFLFDQTQFAFAKEAYDVTDKIIAKLNAVHPQ